MADNISQIKERLNVVDVISGYIKVQKAGMNFKGRCPFHNEKTPSFYISPERQIWHCFGCQKGGDMFTFVKEMEGVEFGEALRILAQRAGIKLESYDPAVQDAKTVLYEICDTASRFFEKQLYHSSAGAEVLSYLKNRGVKESTIKEFRIGFAPEGWRNLSTFLRDCSYSDNDIVNAGLAIRKEDGKDIYDRFRSRIIFPITDINDRIVGFTARIFGEETPEAGGKYINTPQTQIYDKSRVLYCLSKGKTEARRADRCLLVEGNIDAIMSYQAGVKNVAATSGTALTPSHLQLLQRYTSNLDICFDKDQAGQVATRRGIGLALSQNFNIKIVHFLEPDCKDPADYIQKIDRDAAGAATGWANIVQSAKPVIDFYFDKLRSELDLASVDGKKAIIINLGPLIKRLTSRVERAHWISRLAAVLKTKEEAVEADILSVKDDLETYDHPGQVLEKPKVIQKQQEDVLSQALLMVIFRNPVILKDEINRIDIRDLDLLAGEVVIKLKSSDLEKFNFDEFIKGFDKDAAMKLEFAYLKSQELLKDFSDEDLRQEFQRIRESLDHKSVSAQLAAMEMDIKEAEVSGDKNKVATLLAQFSDLTKKLKR